MFPDDIPGQGIVRASVSAVAKTLLFTVFVPGTVTGYVPWLLRQDAAPVTGPEKWASIAVIALGIGIYLYTAFWGFALIGGGTPAPIAPTKILVVRGLHRFVRNDLADRRADFCRTRRVFLHPVDFAANPLIERGA